MNNETTKEYALAFLDEQERLFDRKVATTVDEAIDYLNEVMAEIFDEPSEIIEYWDECGMDVLGMTEEDVLEASEVFKMPDGKLMLVEA